MTDSDYYEALYVGAMNDLRDTRAELTAALAAKEKAEANYRFMVERAADEKLDGYRELAAKCAALESRADSAESEAARLKDLRDEAYKVRDESIRSASYHAGRTIAAESEAARLTVELGAAYDRVLRVEADRDRWLELHAVAEKATRDTKAERDRLRLAPEHLGTIRAVLRRSVRHSAYAEAALSALAAAYPEGGE